MEILSLGLNYGGKITQSKQKLEYLIRLRQIGSNDFQKLHLSLATSTVSHNAYSLKCLQKFRNASAPCEIRTHDLQFTRLLLYPWANEASVWTPISLNVFWQLSFYLSIVLSFVCVFCRRPIKDTANTVHEDDTRKCVFCFMKREISILSA